MRRRILLLPGLLALSLMACAQMAAPGAQHSQSADKAKAAAAQPTEKQLDAVPRITVEELKALRAKDKNVVIVDARAGGGERLTIPGAIRVPPNRVEEHLAELQQYKGRPIVAFCT